MLGRIRVDQANALHHDKPARKVVKGSRWLLLLEGVNNGILKNELLTQCSSNLALARRMVREAVDI
jgi:hypothetical protein